MIFAVFSACSPTTRKAAAQTNLNILANETISRDPMATEYVSSDQPNRK